ncbi:hypothetical protein SBA5_120079 [Candidatus Sulfotelmatomonas gaucii]|uniref:Uncharacterized protein n=1 Tax=Candidatus Sulfuritelmatomonas gaucii TaxID=2043161 RepID=A0A2N9L4C9_9BACT|nr:hypothetical protein SBA5_120079 [Candidatus Sulfotelmatomonas gaucii]
MRPPSHRCDRQSSAVALQIVSEPVPRLDVPLPIALYLVCNAEPAMAERGDGVPKTENVCITEFRNLDGPHVCACAAQHLQNPGDLRNFQDIPPGATDSH